MAKRPTQRRGADGASKDADQGVQVGGAQLPSALEPWKDETLAPTERLKAYKTFLHEKIAATLAAVDALRGDATKQLEIRDAPETKHLMKEAAWVREVSAEQFCQRMDTRTPLELAQEMVASYRFDRSTGASTFRIPAGVSDIEAMMGVNEYFRSCFPDQKREAIFSSLFTWYEVDLPVRDMTQRREVTIIAVVEGTMGKDRNFQERVLVEQGLHFADLRDQVLAAALHACVNRGEDLFLSHLVRGSVPEYAVLTDKDRGVNVYWYNDANGSSGIAASGSPSP
ncbi:MAG: hypothetical protein RL518_1617 [Pseudomonadota bacterium]|jgi:hypothetical protein